MCLKGYIVGMKLSQGIHFMITDFPWNVEVWRKWQKNHFFGRRFPGQAAQINFELKILKLLKIMLRQNSTRDFLSMFSF